MLIKKQSAVGATLAMAVAGLVGCASSSGGSSQGTMAAASNNATDMMHCYSVNACKGHNACKTAENACAGQGSCKGHGFIEASVKACGDIGGEKKDTVMWEASTADFIHCSGINVCKGHNDCKTASNACAGHGSCKGQGFVALSAKSCADIGGNVDS